MGKESAKSTFPNAWGFRVFNVGGICAMFFSGLTYVLVGGVGFGGHLA